MCKLFTTIQTFFLFYLSCPCQVSLLTASKQKFQPLIFIRFLNIVNSFLNRVRKKNTNPGREDPFVLFTSVGNSILMNGEVSHESLLININTIKVIRVVTKVRGQSAYI